MARGARGKLALVEPTPESPSGAKWYEQYPRLNSAKFIAENSGVRAQLPPPYEIIRGDTSIVGIEGRWGMEQLWKPVGFSESPPFPTSYPAVAILFESTTNFEQIWWHYPLE